MKTQSTKIVASWLLLAIPATLAHTWVEQLSVIAPNGTFVGAPGFSRGYMSREEAGFEDNMVYLLPPDGRANELLSTDTICKSTQGVGNQTSGFPTLEASPGDNIALRYQENGHVTLPDAQIGKPANRGTVYIYGTTESSSSDKILDIHRVWNAEGTGGDGRGVLLATRNFDDGQCYQVNGGNISTARQAEFQHDPNNALMGVNLWCQTDVQLPSNVTGDSYTLYWVWDWPTLPNITGSGEPDGKIEIYTTCMDISMTPASASTQKDDVSFIVGQQLDFAAIQDQLTAEFQVTTSTADPYTTIANGAGAGSPTSASSAIASTTTAAQSFSSSAAAVQSSGSSAAAATVTVTVTQATATAIITMQPNFLATSFVTITVNGNAASVPPLSAPPATSSPGPVVTPFLQPSETNTLAPTVVADSVATDAPGINGTTSNFKKMLRSHIARRLH